MSVSAARPARRSFRTAAVALATALPLSLVTVGVGGTLPAAVAADAPAYTGAKATVNAPFPTRDAAAADGYVPADQANWRDWVYRTADAESPQAGENTGAAGERYARMEERKVHSPSMNRDIPVVVIRAKENAANAPTIYLLNGADGGTGKANWLQQTTAVDFYGNRIGNVNVVIPMAGGFSYYTDWEQTSVLDKDGHGKGGKQKWETFLTGELPSAMESALGTSSPKRAIIGMSMSGSSVLVFGEQHKGLYDAIGSYSGCPATTGVGSVGVDLVLGRGDSTYDQMWGDRNGEVAKRNDAQRNVALLKDQKNIYVSSGTGLIGKNDLPTSGRMEEIPYGSVSTATEGGIIEGATNVCTQTFKAAAEQAGVDHITWNLRDTGTHQWGYWQDDMYQSWPTIARGLGFDVTKAKRQAAAGAAAYDEAHPGVGSDVTLPNVSEAWNAAWQETYGEEFPGSGN